MGVPLLHGAEGWQVLHDGSHSGRGDVVQVHQPGHGLGDRIHALLAAGDQLTGSAWGRRCRSLGRLGVVRAEDFARDRLKSFLFRPQLTTGRHSPPPYFAPAPINRAPRLCVRRNLSVPRTIDPAGHVHSDGIDASRPILEGRFAMTAIDTLGHAGERRRIACIVALSL